MDSTKAFIAGIANRGRPLMVFDWKKAAQLIKERKPTIASAGLKSDWEYTGGVIYENGEPVTDSYTYLASTWATPELNLDGDIIECFVMQNETEWDADTKWPKIALDILNS